MFFLPPRIAESVSHLPSAPDAQEAVIAPPVQPALASRTTAACASHALRDFAGQTLGRLLGLGAYSLLATLGEVPMRVASGIAGAGAGGRLGYLIASRQIGIESYGQCIAVGACTMVGTLMGGVIAGAGSNQLICGVAAGSLMTAAASFSSTCSSGDEQRKEACELTVGTAIGMTCAGIGVASGFDPQWKAGTSLLPARNLGLLVESTVIELCKSSFERVGPSVNRNLLSFEGKVIATLLGMAPYVAATVLLNGYVSGLLRPGRDSPDFGELAAPLIVGAIANAVRGGTNAFVVIQLHAHGRFTADGDAGSVRDHAGVRWPDRETVFNKSCIRYLLSACRNAVYARLRDSGMSVEQAAEIAQGVYACYAQCRDLIHDVARGEGWSEPRMRTRHEVSTA